MEQRLIDADALKEWFSDNGEGSWTYNVTVKACIDAQPTVDAVPVKRGKWIEEHCSECGQYVYHGDALNYCPKCGARMDKYE